MFRGSMKFSSRLDRIAMVLSIALIPPVNAAVVFFVFAFRFENGQFIRRVLLAVVGLFFTNVLPMIYVLWLRRRRRVSAYDVPEKDDRTLPYMFAVVSSLAGMVVLLALDAGIFLWGLAWCYGINTAVLAVINTQWKISAHLMGLTGPLTLLVLAYGIPVLLAFPVVVVLGWARIHLKAHTPDEIIAGALAGVVLVGAQVVVGMLLLPGALDLPW